VHGIPRSSTNRRPRCEFVVERTASVIYVCNRAAVDNCLQARVGIAPPNRSPPYIISGYDNNVPPMDFVAVTHARARGGTRPNGRRRMAGAQQRNEKLKSYKYYESAARCVFYVRLGGNWSRTDRLPAISTDDFRNRVPRARRAQRPRVENSAGYAGGAKRRPQYTQRPTKNGQRSRLTSGKRRAADGGRKLPNRVRTSVGGA